jgi:ABC-type antimicrobial peptide transport system permease subunit
VRRAIVQVAIGLVAGILCTLAWDAVFSTGSAERFARPGNLVPVAALLLAAVLLASFMPARQATRLDPVAALRGD